MEEKNIFQCKICIKNYSSKSSLCNHNNRFHKNIFIEKKSEKNISQTSAKYQPSISQLSAKSEPRKIHTRIGMIVDIAIVNISIFSLDGNMK